MNDCSSPTVGRTRLGKPTNQPNGSVKKPIFYAVSVSRLWVSNQTRFKFSHAHTCSINGRNAMQLSSLLTLVR